MTVQRSPYPSIRQLRAAVDRLEPKVSATRLRQLRMTVRQMERALDGDVLPQRARREVRSLLNPRNVDTFLETAAAGAWRDRPEKGGLSWSSLATLRDCLKILGEESGLGGLVLPRVYRERLDLRPTVPPAQQAVMYRRLADLAARGPVDVDGPYPARVRAWGRVRLLAMVGVVLDTGARAGELSGMRLPDLSEDLSQVRVVRAPQNAAHLPTVEEQLALREGTRRALRRWLPVRESLVVPLQGGRDALWVSLCRARGPAPGMPLRARGVERSYGRAALELNAELLARWDESVDGPWVPLPTRLDTLRRSADQARLSG